MTVKHTPGPWTFEDREDRVVIHQPEGAPVWLAEVASIDMMSLDEEQDAVSRENCALIAAAPDLADALEAFLLAFQHSPAHALDAKQREAVGAASIALLKAGRLE